MQHYIQFPPSHQSDIWFFYFQFCIKHVKLQADETITSYDVSALFTSVPIEAAINIIQRRLELDQELHSRTNVKCRTYHQSTGVLPENNSYFQFQGSFYEQINGAAMGSPISPIVANLFMEDFEVKGFIQSAKNPPKMWKRYVDDTCVILSSASKDEFSQHINNIDPRIQFTFRGFQTRWVNSFSGLFGHTTIRWINYDNCLQKTNTY